jgi:hypothetical protein
MIKKIAKLNIIIYILAFVAGISYASDSNWNWNVRNVADNSLSETIDFDTIQAGDTYKLANQYIELNYQLDEDITLWKMEVAGEFKNTSAPDYKMPLAWRVYNTKPGSVTPGNPESDISWNWMYGSDSENAIQLMSGTTAYAKLADGTDCSFPLYIYIEGKCNQMAAGDYTGSIWLTHYNLSDISAPEITHVPIAKIGVVGNNIKIEARIVDDKQIVGADLYYQIDKGPWKKKIMNITDNPVYTSSAQNEIIIKYCSSVIDSKEVYGSSLIKYYIETTDGINLKKWKSAEAPQLIEISRKTEFVPVNEGTLTVEDGNSEDGSVSLELPKGALDKKEKITIEQCDTEDNSIPDGNGATDSERPVAVYDFGPSGLNFKRPVTITLLYMDKDHNGDVESQSDEDTSITENELGIFWWDGFDWRLIGGKVDTEKNTVTAQINHFSTYAIFPVKPLTADDYRPKERIITPATQGDFDFALFEGLSGEYEIKIYDITGREVRTLDETSLTGSSWDGKDEYGNLVESGVYIYQFEAKVEGKMELISGTIAVAK